MVLKLQSYYRKVCIYCQERRSSEVNEGVKIKFDGTRGLYFACSVRYNG
jgi:hypothetical protein